MGNKPSSSGVVIEVTKYGLQDDAGSKGKDDGSEKPILPLLSSKVLDKYSFSLNSSCKHCSSRLPRSREEPTPQNNVRP